MAENLAFPCPECGAEAKPLRRTSGSTRAREQATSQVFVGAIRWRTCASGHAFMTEELPATASILHNLKVQVEGFSETVGYDSTRLRSYLDEAVGSVLNPRQIAKVISRVEADLTRDMFKEQVQRALGTPQRSGRPPTPKPGQLRRGQFITEAIERALQDEARTSTKPKAQRAFRKATVLHGFARFEHRDVQVAMQWLLQHAQLGEDAPRQLEDAIRETHFRPRVDRWHPLDNNAAPEPSLVVYEGSKLQPEPFDGQRYKETVSKAFHGHTDREYYVRYVVQWVLWYLAGQQIVRRADLMSVTTQCLRRIDPIAYLRWVVVVKDLTEPQLWQEGLGLIRNPMPVLVVDPDGAASPQGTKQTHPYPSSGWEDLYGSTDGVVPPAM